MRASHWLPTLALTLAAGLTPAAAGIDHTPMSAPGLQYPPTPSWVGSDRFALAVAPHGIVYLSWLEPVGSGFRALRFSVLEGGRWSQARTIADSDDWVDLPGETPHLTPQDDGTLLAHWIQNRGLPEDQFYALRVVRSADGAQWYDVYRGRPDSRPVWPRFLHLFSHSGDATGIFFLSTPNQERTLQVKTFGLVGHHAQDVPPLPIAACDGIAVASAPGDAIVAFRRREAAGELNVTHLVGDRWTAQVPVARVSAATCDDRPPAIDRRADVVALAWIADAGVVRVSLSTDQGRHFAGAVTLTRARAIAAPSVAVVDDGSAVVAWLEEGETGGGELRLSRVWPSGRQGPVLPVARQRGVAAASLPRLVFQADRLVVAWQSDRIRTALVPLDRLVPAGTNTTSF